MQSPQLSSFPAAERVGRPSLAEVSYSQDQEANTKEVNPLPDCQVAQEELPPTPSAQHNSSKVEKRARKSGPRIGGPYLHPLPTIETLMTYPSISRPVYDSLVRGEPPAQTYNTVIHTPKPQNLRHLAEMANYRRRKRANSGNRSRSNTASSTASSASGASTSSSTGTDSDSSASDVSEPTSPVSVSSTSKATVASSRSASPLYTLFPSLYARPQQNDLENHALSPALSIESKILDSNSGPPSRQVSPIQSLASDADSDSEAVAPSSSRSSAPSPASSAYPSPPSSPEASGQSSSSGEEYMAYPSPATSPSPTTLQNQEQRLHHRERRAFSTPPRPSITLSPPPLRRRSASLNTHSLSSGYSDTLEFDLDEEVLGGGSVDDDVDRGMAVGDMNWSLYGGEVIFMGDHVEEEVVLGSAGLALSPRALKGNCCHCEGGRGLGLYVIEEEDGEGIST